MVTNDIYTTEDADFLRRAGVLDVERIVPVRTGCCPRTAIRDDIAANLDAVEDLEDRFAPLALVIIESAATTSRPTSAAASSTCRSSCSTSPAATMCRARAAPA